MLSNNNILYLFLCVTIIVSGCATSYAPYDWVPEKDRVPYEAWGGWLYIETIPSKAASIKEFEEKFDSYSSIEKQGELISVDDGKVYILSRDTLINVSTDRILLAKLEVCESFKNYYTLWTVLGTLSTFSHGFYLILSAPAWIITGSIATSSESSRNIFTVIEPSAKWWEVHKKYARFPQGIPPGFDTSTLISKTKTKGSSDIENRKTEIRN